MTYLGLLYLEWLEKARLFKIEQEAFYDSSADAEPPKSYERAEYDLKCIENDLIDKLKELLK
jgi:hypothetical protein